MTRLGAWWRGSWRPALVWAGIIGAAVLLGLLAATLIENATARRDSEEALRSSLAQQSEQRAASLRRFDRMQTAIEELGQEVADGAATVARLEEQVAALRAQLRASGQEPLVGDDPEPSPEPRPSPSSSPQPPPSPSPEPRPSPSPSPSPSPTCDGIDTPLGCIGAGP